MENSVYVLDGGQSSQLQLYIGSQIDNHPLWTASLLVGGEQHIQQIQKDFLKAGSDIIGTVTYQASIDGFKTHFKLTTDESIELMKKSVKMTQSAIDEYLGAHPKDIRPMVAGSVGPYGASLHDGSEYTGVYPPHADKAFLRDWHRPRMAALVEAGADFLALETIPCVLEAEVLLELLQEFPEAKAWLSFSCRDDECLSSGERFDVAVNHFWNTASRDQLVAIGCNCVNPDHVTKLLTAARFVSRDGNIAFIVYPNKGETYCVEQGWSGEAVDLVKHVPEWLDLGVRYIGGCCRTTAADVARIRDIVDSRNKD